MSKIFNNKLNKSIDIIETSLKEYMDKDLEYTNNLLEAMNYSLFTGGKRLRPVFGLETFKLFSKDVKMYLPFAMAVEMIHTYSLIHDDLPAMDDDDYRRGKETNHKVFGEDMAILAGDALLNQAFELIFESVDYENENIEYYKRHINAGREVAYYAGINGMITGQVIDIHGNKENMDKDKLLYMYKCKTAGLFQAAIISGAIIGGANEKEIESLREFSYYLGLSYQIQDDILDIEEDKEIEKLTYLTYYSKDKAENDMKEYVSMANQALDKLEGKNTDFLKELTKKLVNRSI